MASLESESKEGAIKVAELEAKLATALERAEIAESKTKAGLDQSHRIAELEAALAQAQEERDNARLKTLLLGLLGV